MKKRIIFSLLAATVAFTGCKKKEEEVTPTAASYSKADDASARNESCS